MTENLLLLVQQALPRLDSMYWIMLASRILHIFGAIILLGGLFYLRTVVTSVPLPFREAPGEGTFTPADAKFGGRRAVWAMWTGIASLLLLVTGLLNFIYIVKQNQLHWSYHMLGTVKIALGLALMILAALLAGRSTAAESIRAKLRFWLSVALLLGTILVMLGSVMRTFPRTLKVDVSGPELIAPAD